MPPGRPRHLWRCTFVQCTRVFHSEEDLQAHAREHLQTERAHRLEPGATAEQTVRRPLANLSTNAILGAAPVTPVRRAAPRRPPRPASSVSPRTPFSDMSNRSNSPQNSSGEDTPNGTPSTTGRASILQTEINGTVIPDTPNSPTPSNNRRPLPATTFSPSAS